MKVTVVGTSCTWFKRKNTSFIIDDDIIFDVPEGSYKDIVKCVDIFKTKAVLITHLHRDHCLNLNVITTRHIREDHGRTDKLKIYCPQGTIEKFIQLNTMFYGGCDEANIDNYNKCLEFIYLEDGLTFDIGEYKVEAYKVEHGAPETFGFTFTNKQGFTVGFSADTRVCDNLHKILQKSNVAFVELSATTPHKTHICIEEFEELLKQYPNTKIYAVHTSDVCQEYAVKNGFNYLNDGDVLNF